MLENVKVIVCIGSCFLRAYCTPPKLSVRSVPNFSDSLMPKSGFISNSNFFPNKTSDKPTSPPLDTAKILQYCFETSENSLISQLLAVKLSVTVKTLEVDSPVAEVSCSKTKLSDSSALKKRA